MSRGFVCFAFSLSAQTWKVLSQLWLLQFSGVTLIFKPFWNLLLVTGLQMDVVISVSVWGWNETEKIGILQLLLVFPDVPSIRIKHEHKNQQQAQCALRHLPRFVVVKQYVAKLRSFGFIDRWQSCICVAALMCWGFFPSTKLWGLIAYVPPYTLSLSHSRNWALALISSFSSLRSCAPLFCTGVLKVFLTAQFSFCISYERVLISTC